MIGNETRVNATTEKDNFIHFEKVGEFDLPEVVQDVSGMFVLVYSIQIID